VISLADWVGAVRFLAGGGEQGEGDAAGDFNLTAPLPPTNEEFTKALGAKLHRPTRLRVPAFALQRTLGEVSGEILGSLRVVPAALESTGYRFEHRNVGAILDAALA